MRLRLIASGMADSKPKTTLAIRWAAIGLAVVSFIWLPVEDTTVAFLLAVALGWCAWAGVWAFQQANRVDPISQGRLLAIGAIAGLAVSPMALILALLKAGLHGHGFLDFTNNQLVLIAKTTPGWILLGLLVSWFSHLAIRHPPLPKD
jgi:hypothetical protein